MSKEESNALSSYFVTITYAPWCVPMTPNAFMTLDDEDVQKYMKRLRKHDKKYWKKSGELIKNKPKIIFYLAAEYGTKTSRPHYHMIILNLYELQSLVDAWTKKDEKRNVRRTMGTIYVDEVNQNTIAYTMKYMYKPSTIPRFASDDRLKEFHRMSNNIGKDYLSDAIKKYHTDDLSRYYLEDHTGKRIKMPRYYANEIYNKDQLQEISKIIHDHYEEEERKLIKRVQRLYKGRMTVDEYKEAQRLSRWNKFRKERGRNKI
jgi:hypothetical protein